jgi:type IV pilus secretin PilQ/predicted competence protein
MKTKTLLVIIFLWGMASLSIFLQANANVVIKDIDYLTGEDFVQLHFKIDQMIPIPYVFHPDKNDNTRIVMRMNGVSFEPKKNLFQFESSVIDFIKVSTNTNNTDVDVEIQLKEQVNYRVFTNQKGLYIEFPRIKSISSPPTSASPSASSQPQPADSTPIPHQSPDDVEANEETGTDPGMVTGEDINKNSGNIIRDIKIISKNPNRVKFRVILSGTQPPNFNVIPIPQEPARLAIDFQGTRSKKINKPVNLLNVKQVRGGYNSPSVFRLVFDLKYLKKYKVSPIMGGKMVEVEFFDKDFDHQAAAADPPSTAPIDIEVGEKGLVLSNTSEMPQSINVDKPSVVPGNGGHQDGNGNPDPNSGQTNMVISNIDDNSGSSEVIVTRDQGTTPMITNVTKDNEDFFGEEKSMIKLDNTALQESEEEGAGGDEQDTTTTRGIFERQTIDEGAKKYTGEHMDFNFHNADLKDVIKVIGKISGLNIIMDPGVSGRVTSQITNVPWDQALELFLKINSLDMVQEGNIVRIGRVQDLEAEATRRLKLKEARAMEGDLRTVTATLSFAKAADLLNILKAQLTPRGGILEDKRSNTLIITDIPSRVEIIDKLIESLDTPNPQVSIEARIVETNTNFIESFGIQWGYNLIADASHGNQTTLKFPNNILASGNQFTSQTSPLVGPLGGYAVNLPAGGAQSGTVFSLGNVANTFRLDMAISAMQSKGEGRIISAPKTTTQNNMEASIMQGKQIPVQTLQNNTISVQYRPAALELKVTPQITAEGTIITSIEISNNSADFANLVNNIPPITTQSIKTTVMVPDGGTIVIGGMYRVEQSSTREGIPFFSKLPLLGALFRNKSKRGEQKELLVFITPRIIK